MGHGSFGDRGRCHFSNFTCDMGPPDQEPPQPPDLQDHLFPIIPVRCSYPLTNETLQTSKQSVSAMSMFDRITLVTMGGEWRPAVSVEF